MARTYLPVRILDMVLRGVVYRVIRCLPMPVALALAAGAAFLLYTHGR